MRDPTKSLGDDLGLLLTGGEEHDVTGMVQRGEGHRQAPAVELGHVVGGDPVLFLFEGVGAREQRRRVAVRPDTQQGEVELTLRP